jgi:hypothetical protein
MRFNVGSVDRKRKIWMKKNEREAKGSLFERKKNYKFNSLEQPLKIHGWVGGISSFSRKIQQF